MPRISMSATLVVAAIGVLLSPAFMSSQGQRDVARDIEEIDNRPVIAREVLVKLRDPLPPNRIAQLAAGFDAEAVDPVGRSGLFRIRSRSFNTSALIAALSRRPDVVYAEPNFVVTTLAEPNDPKYPQMWGLKNTGQIVNGAPGTA